MSNLPAPLTPPDCDVRGIEPPWEAFVRLAVEWFGIAEEDARRHIDGLRREFWDSGRMGQ